MVTTIAGFLGNTPIPTLYSCSTSLWAGSESSPFSPLAVLWNRNIVPSFDQNLEHRSAVLIPNLASYHVRVTTSENFNIPGQSTSLHNLMSTKFPSQVFPLLRACWEIVLYRSFSPPAQVWEQEVKSPHSPHRLCTEIWMWCLHNYVSMPETFIYRSRISVAARNRRRPAATEMWDLNWVLHGFF